MSFLGLLDSSFSGYFSGCLVVFSGGELFRKSLLRFCFSSVSMSVDGIDVLLGRRSYATVAGDRLKSSLSSSMHMLLSCAKMFSL